MARIEDRNIATGQQMPHPRTEEQRSAEAGESAATAVEELGVRPPQVTIDGDTFWRVEGDLLLDEDELFVYIQQQAARRQQRQAAEQAGFRETKITSSEAPSAALVGMVQDGKIVRWAPGTVLTYCVLAKTFNSRKEYEEVAANMQRATQDWVETCGVEFEYRKDLDDSDTMRPDATFPVRQIDSNGAFIAAAFFPTDPVSRRRVLIDPSYFSTGFDRVGVLRHELGHVLGFRHEHIRSLAPPVCPNEDLTGTVDLSDYDPQSVMHYFCGGVGSRDLAITNVDRTGSQRVYGPPLNAFVLRAA